jgi:outer membrane protein
MIYNASIAQENTMQYLSSAPTTFRAVSGLRGAVAIACLALGCASAAYAADVAKTDMQTKVAVLDLERAVMTTDVAREKIKALQTQKDYADTQKKIESLQKEMEKKAADAKKEGPTWNVDQQANFRKDMEFMQKDMELAMQKVQGQNQDLERTIMKDMDQKIKDAVEQIIADEKVTVLLRRESVFFAMPADDISDEVTAKLNQQK